MVSFFINSYEIKLVYTYTVYYIRQPTVQMHDD